MHFKSPIASIITLAFVIGSLIGCGENLSVKRTEHNLPETPTTGGQKQETDPSTGQTTTTNYTPSGRIKEFNKLKESMNGKSDKKLAESIKRVKATLVKENQLDVSINLDNQSQFYSLTSPQESGLRKFTEGSPKLNDGDNSSAYRLSAACLENDCSFIEFRLNKIVGTQKGQAAFQYSVQKPKVKIDPPRSAELMPKSELAEFSDPTTKPVTAEQTSVSVVDGGAYTTVVLLQDDKPFATLDSELLDTSEKPIVAKAEETSGDQKISAEIIGNNPETGNLVFDLSAGKDTATEAVRITLIAEAPDASPISAPAPAPRQQIPAPSEGILIPDTKASNILSAVEKFDSYANHPEVLRRIENWKAAKGSAINRERATNFLTYVLPVESLTQKIFEGENITSEYAYVTAIESNFFTPEYPIEVTKKQPACGACTASGPWQIIKRTASSMVEKFLLPYKIFALQIFKNNKKVERKLNPQDDRGYYAQSTHMAAKYFSYLDNMFGHDPALVLLAYKMGEGDAGAAIESTEAKLRRYKNFEVKLSDLIENRMAPQSELNYALNIIAIRTIGRNPKKYEFEISPPTDLRALQGKLANPNSSLPPMLTPADIQL